MLLPFAVDSVHIVLFSFFCCSNDSTFETLFFFIPAKWRFYVLPEPWNLGNCENCENWRLSVPLAYEERLITFILALHWFLTFSFCFFFQQNCGVHVTLCWYQFSAQITFTLASIGFAGFAYKMHDAINNYETEFLNIIEKEILSPIGMILNN